MKLFLLLGVTSQRPKFKNFGYVEIGEFTILTKTGITRTLFSVLMWINPYSVSILDEYSFKKKNFLYDKGSISSMEGVTEEILLLKIWPFGQYTFILSKE